MSTPAVKRREVGELVLEGVPDIPERISSRSLQYQNTRSCMLQDWYQPNPNLKEWGLLLSTRFGDATQLHHVTHPGGDRRQLTFFKEPITSASVCPSASLHPGFIYLKDIGGSEKYQLYYFHHPTGQSIALTEDGSGVMAKNGGVRWNNRGDVFTYYTTKRNGKDHDVRLMTLNKETHKVERDEEIITLGEGWWQPREWAPDDNCLIVKKYVSASDSQLYIFDLATKKLTQIGRKKGDESKIRYGPCCWSHDGKAIYFASNDDGEFQTLKYLHTEKPDEIVTLTGDIKWDIEDISRSADGAYVAFTCNEDGASQLYILETSTNHYQRVDNIIPLSVIGTLAFHPKDPNLLGLVINSTTTPGDIFTLDVSKWKIRLEASKENPGSDLLVQWTFSEVGGLPPEIFISAKLIYFETFDKDPNAVHKSPDNTRRIPAFIYYPDPKRHQKTKFPVLIRIHGGPESQVRPSFEPIDQFLVNEMGIVVIQPNVRGSSGYGSTYLKLDFGFNRLDSLKDIGALIEWIGKQSNLDSDRIAVYGGSYGGYMVLNTLIHYGDKLRCGIENVGITNFVTFLENTESYRRDLRRQVYGDERDPKMREFLLSVSPLTNCQKISKPLLIGQGLNDPRVPVSEAEQLCNAIRANGMEVRYVLAKNEGHGFQKKSNRDFWFNSAYLFLEQFLLEDNVNNSTSKL